MSDANENNPVGRPTKYRVDMALQAEKLCKLGATDKELAEFFQVDEATINRWKISEPEFCESVKNGKILADAEVAHSLYSKAVGSSERPPDTVACIFWLKNRQPTKWRDKTSTELSGSVGMTHEQWLDELDGRSGDDGEAEGDPPPAAG